MLDVTVCILSYNRPAFLREALLSVLAQTGKPKRIAIYDNGSDKGVRESVTDLLGSGVEWVGADVNHTFIWNFTRAMQACDTRYVMMLHDDDKLCPDFLETQIGLLETNTRLVAVSCNGHFIDQAGHRTGGTLVPIQDGHPVELYKFSGQVAMKYADNSCVPLSPAIYRTEVARKTALREDFGKVVDAVYFCDLAEQGNIGYQTKPLYECRAHPGQDSSHFPYDLLNQLEAFFWSRTCADEAEADRLHMLLLKQHATRSMKQIFLALKKGSLLRAFSLLGDPKFKLHMAFQVIGARAYKNTFRKW